MENTEIGNLGRHAQKHVLLKFSWQEPRREKELVATLHQVENLVQEKTVQDREGPRKGGIVMAMMLRRVQDMGVG